MITGATLETLPVTPETDKRERHPKLRLAYLDGLRGVACLYVVIVHAWVQIPWKDAHGASEWLRRLTFWADFGWSSVAVFIVLSGYCLMLPVARSTDGHLRRGVRQYLKRRAIRILPPYYASLVLSLILVALLPAAVSRHAGWWWQSMRPQFAPWPLISHLLMFHNLSGAWAYKINAPMWTVATEWQIYFLLPALLLPVWRRWGAIALCAVGFGVGLIPLAWGEQFEQASPWFVGLFALGMAAAGSGFARNGLKATIRERAPWGMIATILLVVWGVESQWHPFSRHLQHEWQRRLVIDVLIGAAAVSLLMYCTRHLLNHGERSTPQVLRLLESTWLVRLGEFSYSLYLTHAMVLVMLDLVANLLHWTVAERFALLFLLGIPGSIAVAYSFHLAFEKPFTRRASRSLKSTPPQD